MKHKRTNERMHVVVAAPAKLDAAHTYKARVRGIRADGRIEWVIWHGNVRKKGGGDANA